MKAIREDSKIRLCGFLVDYLANSMMNIVTFTVVIIATLSTNQGTIYDNIIAVVRVTAGMICTYIVYVLFTKKIKEVK